MFQHHALSSCLCPYLCTSDCRANSEREPYAAGGRGCRDRPPVAVSAGHARPFRYPFVYECLFDFSIQTSGPYGTFPDFRHLPQNHEHIESH